jgi:hypothetical protein
MNALPKKLTRSALSASVGPDGTGTRPDDGYCHCDEPLLDPADEEAYCFRCRRFLDEDRPYSAWRPVERGARP